MNNFLTLEDLTLSPPFDTIVSIILLAVIIMTGKLLSKKIIFHNDVGINLIICTCINIITIAFVVSYLVVFKFDRDVLRYLIWFFCICITIYFFFTNKINIKNINIDENFIFLLFFFLLSLSPASDADSLDYHLGFPLDVLRNGQFLIRDEWYHSKLAGLGENLILFGLLAGSKNFGQLINFFGLTIILYSIKYAAVKFNSNFKYNYFIFSTPLIVWLTASQKLSLFTSAFFCLILVLLSTGELLKKKELLLFSILSMSFCFFTKISNVIPALIVYTYMFYLCIKNGNLKIIKYSIIILSVIALPYVIKNYFQTGDIYYPVLEYFRENQDKEFLEFYRSLTLKVTSFYELEFKDYFLIPLYYTLPLNVLRPTILLGLGAILIYPIAFKIKNLYQNFEFIFIFLIMFYIILIPSVQPRYFLDAYWALLILIIKYNPLLYLGKKFENILKNILRLQAYFIFLCVVLGIFYLVPGSLNKKNYEQVMSRSAYNYNLLNWIYDNVPKNSIIISNAVRSHALYKNQFVSREGFFRKKDLIKEAKRLKITHFVIDTEHRKAKIVNLINVCGDLKDIKSYQYTDEVRNMFSRIKIKEREVQLIKNKCI